MLYYILGVMAALVAALIVKGMLSPSTFRVERSTVINGSPQTIFAILNDFHQSVHWSPWEKKDLKMKQTISGSPTGKGAIHEWDGNKDVGQGREEIIESIPHSKVVVRLDFFRPFKGSNTAEFLLHSQGASTKMTWIVYGPVNFIVRLIGLNMDKMIGKDFEAGLANMKAYVEGSGKAA